MVTSKTVGDSAEEAALRHLLQHGLTLVQRNYRVAAGPRARGGEIDLIMRERDGTLVFVEVRARSGTRYGGAAASIGSAKRARLIYAAQRFLQHQPTPPPCRFDVIVFEGGSLQWLCAAFDAEGGC